MSELKAGDKAYWHVKIRATGESRDVVCKVLAFNGSRAKIESRYQFGDLWLPHTKWVAKSRLSRRTQHVPAVDD